MNEFERHPLLNDPNPPRDPDVFLNLAKELMEKGDHGSAATAIDLAYGLDPVRKSILEVRKGVLEGLALRKKGIVFRYIPGGWFQMGTSDGDPDEQPVHAVKTGEYWLSETTVSWSLFSQVMGWQPPPIGLPKEEDVKRLPREAGFMMYNTRKIWLQYCEDVTAHARDWHAHDPLGKWQGGGKVQTATEVFGPIDRSDPSRPFQYDQKPIVAISWQDAEEFCKRLSSPGETYRLPTETEWEKAARGGLVGACYPWGNEPPTSKNCDFDHFGDFCIKPFKSLPPNGYGLYAMSGSVWEWTADVYDSLAYDKARSAATQGKQPVERVIRGGSWADCAEAVTVSFRMSRNSESWNAGTWGMQLTPTIGFRICREQP